MNYISVTCDGVLDFLDYLGQAVIIILMVGAAFVCISSVYLYIYSFWSDDVIGCQLGGWNRDQQVADPAFQELRIQQGGGYDTHGHSLVSQEVRGSHSLLWECRGRALLGQRCFRDVSVDQVESLNLGVGKRAGSPGRGAGQPPTTGRVFRCFFCDSLLLPFNQILFSLVEVSVYLMWHMGFIILKNPQDYLNITAHDSSLSEVQHYN